MKVLPNAREIFFEKTPMVERAVAGCLAGKSILRCRIYTVDEGHVKLAAGWLIETAGWKGKVVGHAGGTRQTSAGVSEHGRGNWHRNCTFG